MSTRRIDTTIEVSFDLSEVIISLRSAGGEALSWSDVITAVKELRSDFEGLPDGEEIH